jgi:hypothetical protein
MRPWSEAQTLHLAVAYTNPRRWRTRRELAHNFLSHMATQANVHVHFCEVAFGDRPFEVADQGNPDHLCLRTPHEIWLKENALNLAIQRFPTDWQYGAYLDADFVMTRADWALEAIHLLQHYDWVQLFSNVQHITGGSVPGEGHQPIMCLPSFVLTYADAGRRVPDGWETRSYLPRERRGPHRFPGTPGGGWAFRRSTLNAVGGLLDRCILGSGDSHMAFGMVGGIMGGMRNWRHGVGFTPGYIDYVRGWQERAAQCHGNVGYVDQMALHHFHGPMHKRGYGTRDDILREERFDPFVDVYPDGHGVLQLSPNKPRLRARLQEYFRSRCEDLP